MRNNKFKLTTLAASLMLASGSLMADDHDARAIAERALNRSACVSVAPPHTHHNRCIIGLKI